MMFLHTLIFYTLFTGPRWASRNLGIFLCIRCAGIHRNLGVHISKVKSVNLDTWTPEQISVSVVRHVDIPLLHKYLFKRCYSPINSRVKFKSDDCLIGLVLILCIVIEKSAHMRQ